MTAYVSRRNFLVASGTGAAALCVSGNAGGYTGAEMRARAEDDSLVGISKWDLETPALCVDVDKLARNLSTMQAKLAAMKVASRPHAKTHKCPTIARMQLASGSVGICTAKLGEAEVFAANGIEPILMTTSNVSPSKIRRAMALRTRNPQFVQAVDHPDNARDLDAAAKAAGVVADVVIDVAVGTRSGVPADERALALGQLVDTLHNLRLRGIISYDGGAQHIKGFKNRLDQTLNRFAPSLETYGRFQKSGLSTEIFSGGGTGTYNILPRAGHLTDLQVGSYIFMDCQYLDIGGESNDEVFTDFESSLTVVSTVLNTYFPKSITTDAGAKALTLNKPGPWVIGEKDFRYNAGSDEFGVISYENAQRSYKVGDKLELIVPHCDPAVNEYDQIYGTRKDKVEVVWPITARGHSQ
jgi:D-serine deaminase-like pyridoxal phosphate-dependent protein